MNSEMKFHLFVLNLCPWYKNGHPPLDINMISLFNLFQTYSLLTILKGRDEMGVAKAGENYKCNICGNEVTVTKAGGGVLVCCGEEMEKTS